MKDGEKNALAGLWKGAGSGLVFFGIVFFSGLWMPPKRTCVQCTYIVRNGQCFHIPHKNAICKCRPLCLMISGWLALPYAVNRDLCLQRSREGICFVTSELLMVGHMNMPLGLGDQDTYNWWLYIDELGEHNNMGASRAGHSVEVFSDHYYKVIIFYHRFTYLCSWMSGYKH